MPTGRRWPAFSASLTCHAIAIGFVVWVDATFQPEPPSANYTVVIVPKKIADDSKVIWYDARNEVPEVTPEKAFGPAERPTGQKDPGRILITLSPDAASDSQLIRQPLHPEPIPTDVPVPNLVVLPKPFTPPTPKSRTPTTPSLLEQAPVLDAPKAPLPNALGALTTVPKPPVKAFVAPPRTTASRAKPAPEASLPEPPAVAMSQAPEAVIVGLNPAAGILPPGSRSARFAKAPEAGIPSSGATRLPDSATVPDLIAHGRTGQPPPGTETVSLPRGIPKEIEFAGVNRTMSAPLRPSSRVIPAGVEAVFAGRNVYTLVIPGPGLPEYPGDWVMWFSERQLDNDPGLRILAPIPARKYTSKESDPTPLAPPSTATIRFSATIDRNGRLASPRILRSTASEAFRLKATAELETWEFNPALRNGVPVDVDIVVEIPLQLRLPVQVSQ